MSSCTHLTHNYAQLIHDMHQFVNTKVSCWYLPIIGVSQINSVYLFDISQWDFPRATCRGVTSGWCGRWQRRTWPVASPRRGKAALNASPDQTRDLESNSVMPSSVWCWPLSCCLFSVGLEVHYFSPLHMALFVLGTLRPRQNGCHIADSIWKWILCGNYCVMIRISQKIYSEAPNWQ